MNGFKHRRLYDYVDQTTIEISKTMNTNWPTEFITSSEYYLNKQKQCVNNSLITVLMTLSLPLVISAVWVSRLIVRMTKGLGR